MVYFTSDLHIGHNNITKYRIPFSTAEEHHTYMVTLIKSLTKRDLLIVLGDFLFDSPDYLLHKQQIESAPCRIKLIMGNHDSKLLYSNPPRNVEVQLPLYSYKNMWISHCPIHPHEIRDRVGNLHGHMHLSSLDDSKYFNVNIDVNGYQFVSLDTIKDYYDR